MNEGNIFKVWVENATFFDWLTNATALIAVALLLLVIIGFRRYIRRPRSDAIDHIGTGVWIMGLWGTTRLTVWDLLWDFGILDWIKDSDDVNWASNLLACLGAWHILKGFHILVEERAPGEYSVWTAVFYPKRFRLSRIERERKEG